MKYAIVFKMENGLPVSSRMLRFSAVWYDTEIMAHCKMLFGKDASITIRHKGIK